MMRNVIMKTASEAERQELEAWINSDPENADEFEDMKLFYGLSGGEDETGSEEWNEPYKRIQEAFKNIKKKNLRIRRWVTAGMAAAITVLLWTTGLYLSRKPIGWEAERIYLTADLSFKDEPLRNVLQVLGESNHLMVTVASGEVWECRFTGMLCKGITVAEALAVLADAENLQYTYGTGNVWITGTDCTQANGRTSHASESH